MDGAQAEDAADPRPVWPEAYVFHFDDSAVERRGSVGTDAPRSDAPAAQEGGAPERQTDGGVGDDEPAETAAPGAAADLVDRAVDAALEDPTEEHDSVPPASLVETLVETAAPRRKKRRRADDQDERGAPTLASATKTNGEHAASAAVESDDVPLALTPGAAPALEAPDDPAWREAWPDNEVRIVGRLLPRTSDAPALDGVQRTRMEIALVEQVGDAFGTMGNLPIFVMPGAPGFTPIYNEIQRARKQKRRLEPIMVELEGVLRQMPDRDTRYAQARNTVLMGVEAHKITRMARDAEQFAYWRGRATVVECRSYEHRGMPYQRVTAVVALKQRKPRLRGVSITHVPVEFLVAREHEHVDRFRHIGQRLLIEATIAADVHRMGDHHPALEGIEDPRRKAQLQVLRESVVLVTLGEFPDEAAERAYRGWVKAGRPRPSRRPGQSRVSVATRVDTVPTGANARTPEQAQQSDRLAPEAREPRAVAPHGREAPQPPRAQRVGDLAREDSLTN
jgi:hypothetical protein